jgi:hypothetical protein
MADDTPELILKHHCDGCGGDDFSPSVQSLTIWQLGETFPYTIIPDKDAGLLFFCKRPECTRKGVARCIAAHPVTKARGVWIHTIIICDNMDVCDVPNPDGWAAMNPGQVVS